MFSAVFWILVVKLLSVEVIVELLSSRDIFGSFPACYRNHQAEHNDRDSYCRAGCGCLVLRWPFCGWVSKLKEMLGDMLLHFISAYQKFNLFSPTLFCTCKSQQPYNDSNHVNTPGLKHYELLMIFWWEAVPVINKIIKLSLSSNICTSFGKYQHSDLSNKKMKHVFSDTCCCETLHSDGVWNWMITFHPWSLNVLHIVMCSLAVSPPDMQKSAHGKQL